MAVMDVSRWHVIGGSWGSFLALAYAQEHPDRASSIVLRGLFLGSRDEMDWFYRSGLDHVFPDKWARFVEPVPSNQQGDLLSGYWSLLNSGHAETAKEAARTWRTFEREVSSLTGLTASHNFDAADEIADAKIQIHYFLNRCFVDEGALLNRMRRLEAVPADLIHGRYDMPCPLKFAWQVHEAWPEAAFQVAEGSGHSSREPLIQELLLNAIARRARGDLKIDVVGLGGLHGDREYPVPREM